MNIALLNLDKTRFPNLAMMKVSQYHKSLGDSISTYCRMSHTLGEYDRVYTFSIFSWTSKKHVTPDMVCGGTGFDLITELPEEIDNTSPDYSLYPDFKQSLGFLTRGCFRKCKECVVPEKEGKLRPYRDIEQIANTNEVILMDNNILGCDYGLRQIEKIAELGLKVDFNQGLDARLITSSVAKLLSNVKWLAPLRMACDSLAMIEPVRKATELLRKHGCTPSTYFVYVLVSDIESAHTRVVELRKMGLDPFAQPYRDKNGTKPSKIISDFARWVNHKAILATVKWNDYSGTIKKGQRADRPKFF